MDNFNLYHYRVYYHHRSKELVTRADQERLAMVASSGQRTLRFYYPAMATVGRFLIASGQHLQKRYGEICELQAPAKPAHRNA